MIKKFKYHLLGYTKKELINLVEGEFSNIQDAKDEVNYYVEGIFNLYDNGGEVYRLLFLNNESDLDTDNLGEHWILDPGTLDRFYHGLSSGDTKGDKPYLITAKIEPKQIDLKSSVEQFIQLPSENEINLLYQPVNYKIEEY